MGGVLIGILATLIQLGVMIGVVVLIVKLVGGKGKDKTSTESAGVIVRRLFVYLLMLIMLVLAGIGLAGLIEAALPSAGEVTDSSAAAARSIAFVIVGLPVYITLALYTRRHLETDPMEQRSTGWMLYLTVAQVGSLLATMALAGGILSDVSSGNSPEPGIIIHGVIWAIIWGVHWWVASRYEPRNTQVQLLLGSAIGLLWTFAGAIATASALLSTIYDGLFLESITGGSIDDLLRPAMILVVGAPVWWWYWIRYTRDGERTMLWYTYTLLLGVLGGVVTTITGAGILLFTILQWFLGDAARTAAAQFDVVPGAIASLLVGGVVWLYHARVLGEREERSRNEVQRVYDYLLAGAGLVVAASGVATLIATALKGISSSGATATSSGDILPIALTLLIIGVPLWWRYWSTIQRCRRDDPDHELRSITRRIYIVGLFGVAGIVAVVSLIVIVFIGVEDMLEGDLGRRTLDSSAVAIALLLTAGALAWYHLVVFREDREVELPEDETPTPEHEADKSLVQLGALEEAVGNLLASGHASITVSKRADGYRLDTND